MLRIAFVSTCIFFSLSLHAQYDAECFNNTRDEILSAIKSIRPDTLHFPVHDTIDLPDGKKRYIDTTYIALRGYDVNPQVSKIIGCKMPDFSFFNIDKKEMSVYGVPSDFTLICFNSTTYGDVCNARLHQFCRMKDQLKDSLTVLNIFEEPDKKVVEYAKYFENNVEFIANADLLQYSYAMNLGAMIYVLDKYKNIIYVKSGQDYVNTPDEIYSELMDKIRSYSCKD
jgi:hypothetical protein